MTSPPHKNILKKVPSSTKENFILGNLHAAQSDPVGLLQKTFQECGSVGRVRVGHIVFYVVTHPSLARHVLQKHNDIYMRMKRFTDVIKLWTGVNLFTSDNDEDWLRRRRIMQPAFHKRKITHFDEIILHETKKMLARWDKQPAGQPVDMQQMMMQLSMQLIGRTMFNIDMAGESQELLTAYQTITEYISYRALNPLSLPLFIPTQANTAFKQALDIVAAHIEPIIATDKKEGNEKPTLVDRLITARDDESGASLSADEVFNEAQNIVFAGYETVAQTLSWVWYLLAKHPQVQQKAREEIQALFGDSDPEVDGLSTLTYTQGVIQEAMRLYPAVWNISRQALVDDDLNGYLIPKGSNIVVNTYGIHRHPDYWPQPNTFNPERFTPEQDKAREPFAFLPFGGGPHKCIGAPLGMLECQLITAKVLQHTKLTLAPNHEVQPKVKLTLSTKDGVMVIRTPIQ